MADIEPAIKIPSMNAIERNRRLGLAGEPRPVVIVLGMHRSGTSLCSHILSALGVEMTGGPVDRELSPSNAKGHWERAELRELHDRALEYFNRGYYNSCHDLPLPASWWADPGIRPIRDQMLAFLREKMPDRTLFGFKDPRTARLLPLWRHIFCELGLAPKIILCLRNPAHVARSLTARDGLDPRIGEYRWFVYMAEVFRHAWDWEICSIEYDDWFPDPMTNMGKLTRFLDREDACPDLRITAAAIVDSGLRHNGIEYAEARQPLVRSLYRLARNSSEDARDSIAQIIRPFAAYQELQQPIYSEFERLSQVATKLSERDLELAAAESRVEELSTTGQALREALAECTAQLIKAERTARDTASAEAQIAALQEKVRHAEALNTQYESDNDCLRRRYEILEGEIADRDARLAQADREAAEQRRRMERLYGELGAVSEDVAARERALGDAIRLAEQVAAELRSAQAELAISDSLREECEQERDHIARQMENLTRERDRFAAESARWCDAALLAEWGNMIEHSPPRSRWVWLPVGRAKRTGLPMIVQADRARDERRWERAARFYLEALRRHPDKPVIWIQLGHALREAGKIVEAEFAYRKATELDPTNFDAFWRLGALLHVRGRDTAAIDAYNQARDLAPQGEVRDAIAIELAGCGKKPGMRQDIGV